MTKFERCVIELLIIIANRTMKGTSSSDRVGMGPNGWPTYGGEPIVKDDA